MLGRIDDHDRFIRGLGEFEIAQEPNPVLTAINPSPVPRLPLPSVCENAAVIRLDSQVAVNNAQ